MILLSHYIPCQSFGYGEGTTTFKVFRVLLVLTRVSQEPRQKQDIVYEATSKICSVNYSLHHFTCAERVELSIWIKPLSTDGVAYIPSRT